MEDYLLFVHEEHGGALAADEAAAAQRLTSAGPQLQSSGRRALKPPAGPLLLPTCSGACMSGPRRDRPVRVSGRSQMRGRERV